jgi:hypothetical protein
VLRRSSWQVRRGEGGSKGCEVRWRVVEKGVSEKPANEKVTDRK